MIGDVLEDRERAYVEHARYETFAKSIPDGSVSLCWLDPPYFRVVDEAWDKQWRTETEYLAWLREVVREAARVLAKNGSLYLFASPAMAARAECLVAEEFNVLNHIVWVKAGGWFARNEVETQRGYRPQTERVIFAETRAQAESRAIGDLIRSAREAAGISTTDLAVAVRGTPSGAVSNWESGLRTPTRENFTAALRVCGDERTDEEMLDDYDSLTRQFAAELAPTSRTFGNTKQ